jgi:hypothetical protein
VNKRDLFARANYSLVQVPPRGPILFRAGMLPASPIQPGKLETLALASQPQTMAGFRWANPGGGFALLPRLTNAVSCSHAAALGSQE